MATKLLIDTDIGDNVDDAFALVLAARLPEVELVGVTTVGSAAWVRAQLARMVLGICGRVGVPVSAGCSCPLVGTEQHYLPEQAAVLDEMDKLFIPPSDSVDFLRNAIRQNPGDLVIVALGAMTNLALALRVEPALIRSVKSVVMMAGSATLNYAETNVRRDPEAAHIVFSSVIPFVMVGKDVTQHAVMSETMLERLSASQLAWCQLLWEMTQIWQRSTGAKFPVLNDPLTVAIAVHPELAQTQRARVQVELRGEHTRGYTVVTPDPTGSGQIVRVVDWQAFWGMMEKALFHEGA